MLPGSFVTLSSRHPSWATLTRRLVASVGSVVAPPPLLFGVLSFKLPKQALPALSHYFHTTHFTSTLGALGLLLRVDGSWCVSATCILTCISLTYFNKYSPGTGAAGENGKLRWKHQGEYVYFLQRFVLYNLMMCCEPCGLLDVGPLTCYFTGISCFSELCDLLRVGRSRYKSISTQTSCAPYREQKGLLPSRTWIHVEGHGPSRADGRNGREGTNP
jgi:hypothetical protein